MAKQNKLKLMIVAIIAAIVVPSAFKTIVRAPLFISIFVAAAMVCVGLIVVLFIRWFRSLRNDTESGNTARRRVLSKALLLCIFLPVIGLLLVAVDDAICRRMYVERLAITELRSSQSVKELLGAQISVGWPITGDLDVSSETGHANFDIPVRGMSGRGTLHVVSTKSDHLWSINKAYLTMTSSKNQIPISSR